MTRLDPADSRVRTSREAARIELPSLRSARLAMRGLEHAHAPFVVELMTDREVRRYLGGVVPTTSVEASLAALFRCDAERFAWLVETIEPSQPIGVLSLARHREDDGWDLSYPFRPEAWGRGFAMEAGRSALAFA